MSGDERIALLEEEALIVRHSGEIPEIALHGSLYYLTADEDGPQLVLAPAEMAILQEAAEQRFQEIVLRDLDPRNRDLSLYRGVARTIANWHRYQTFCRRFGRDSATFRRKVRQAVTEFLCNEYRDVASGTRRSSINCAFPELQGFLQLLEVDTDALQPDWPLICDYPAGEDRPWK